MSTEVIEIDGGPLTTSKIKVIRYCCAADVVDKELATDRRSIRMTVDRVRHWSDRHSDPQSIDLTYNQAILLAESITQSLK